jgi:hypothetical protein
MAVVIGDSREHFISQPFLDAETVIGLLAMFENTKKEARMSQATQADHWCPAEG